MAKQTIKLAEFIGEILKDIASARTYADYSAASLSEEYHADPFIKGLPIPHYIIDEAEVNVPVMVVGLNTQDEGYDKSRKHLNEIVKDKLSEILLETFKWNFINERIKRQEDQKAKSGENTDETDYKNFDFPKEILIEFEACIKKISHEVCKKFEQNLNLYNYKVLKLLELTETFSKELGYALKSAIKVFSKEKSKKDNNPFLTAESVNNAIKYTSSIMFFNFKKVIQSEASVLVDINTSTMNQYAQNNCLMHIKLKIKEQDLNLLVEEQDKKERRFLSLT